MQCLHCGQVSNGCGCVRVQIRILEDEAEKGEGVGAHDDQFLKKIESTLLSQVTPAKNALALASHVVLSKAL